MKSNGHWIDCRHLLCRWHVYEAIKRYCGKFFKLLEKGKQKAELTRFIDAFKNVVCAPHVSQRNALWSSMIVDGGFPEEAVQHVRKGYFDNPRTRKIMECFVFDSGNLCQTTTSRNEGSHAAFRSKTNVVPKPADAYLLRRKHNALWMSRLRSQAINSQNRIPLEIQHVPELRKLIKKVSLFALSEIHRQVIQARMEETKGVIRESGWENGLCECHAFRRYGLPCWHMVPTDGTAILLEHIAPFWRIDNWNRGICQSNPLIIEPISNIKDARETLHFYPRQPTNNISISDIVEASVSNLNGVYSEGLNMHLNDATRRQQAVLLEDKLTQFGERFKTAPDSVKSRMLNELDRELNMMEREERNNAEVQDPPEMSGRRTSGKGGKRRLTAAERAEKELERNDKGSRQHQQGSIQSAPDISAITVIDLTGSTPSNTPQRISAHSIPFIMTFSPSGKVIRSPQQPPKPPRHPVLRIQPTVPLPDPVTNASQVESTDLEIEILETHSSEGDPPVRKSGRKRRQKEQPSRPHFNTKKSPQKSTSSAHTPPCDAGAILGRSGVLVQPVKRRKLRQ